MDNFHTSRLWSLWDMLKRYGLPIYMLCTALEGISWRTWGTGVMTQVDVLPAAHEHISYCKEQLGIVKKLCEELDMKSIEREADRILETLSSPMIVERFGADMRGLNRRVEDDLVTKYFFYIRGDKTSYFDSDTLAAESVYEKFSSRPAILDHLKEAGTCFSLERYSACVYHLVGVMDLTFKTIAKSLNTKVDTDEFDWEKIIQAIETGVKERVRKHPSTWTKKKPVYDSVILDLRAIRKVLRNPAAHYRKFWTESEAHKVFRSTIDFLEDYSKIK